MPKQSGGAQQFRRGDRIRIIEKGAYRYYLRGLLGEVTQVLHHGLIVALDNDPAIHQKVMGAGGVTGPAIPNRAQRQFMFHEVEKVNA